jgi:hypothetical protein
LLYSPTEKLKKMKKIFAVVAVSALLSSCHYGVEEAQSTLKANEEYKSEKADYSVNKANVEVEKSAETSVSTDTTAKAE